MTTYYVWSGAAGAADGSSFTDAYVSLDALFVARAIAGGDIIKIADDHANTAYGASKTFNFPEASQSTSNPVYLISTNRGTGNPSVGAIEQTANGFSLTFAHKVWCYGVTFKVGSGGASAANITFGAGSQSGGVQFRACVFQLDNTASTSRFIFADASGGTTVRFEQCTFTFGATGQDFRSTGTGIVTWVECSLGGATFPTTLMSATGAARYCLTACDFSGPTNLANNTIVVGFEVKANNCVLPANIVSGALSHRWNYDIELQNCGVGDHNYYYYSLTGQGEAQQDTTVYLDSGATFKTHDGSAVPLSTKMISNSSANDVNTPNPLYSPWFYAPVFSTGSKTFTLKVGHTEASVYKDIEVFLEVEALTGSTNTPLTQRHTTAPVISGTRILDVLAAGSDLTDTAEAWTGITSEKTHALAKTVTITEQGWVRGRVGLTVANRTIYVNPELLVA